MNRYGYNPCRPTTIQGVTYPSRVAAAKALGVTPEAVRQAFSSGNPDKIGSRKGQKNENPSRDHQ